MQQHRLADAFGLAVRTMKDVSNITSEPRPLPYHKIEEFSVMEALKNRIKVVYNDLGRVLNSPESFGLGERAPQPLVTALTAMRQKLMEELIDLKQWEVSDNLSAELSQDSDRPVPLDAKSKRTA